MSAEKKVSINGVLYDFKYKVVFDKPTKVDAGVEVRCLNLDGSIRGEGIAKSPLETNYFSYRVIWLEYMQTFRMLTSYLRTEQAKLLLV